VTSSFASIEHDAAVHLAHDLEQEIASQQEQIRRVNIDYAVWDDTYRFLRGEEPSYVERNLVNSTFDANHLDAIILADTSGAPLFLRVIGAEGDLPIAAQTEIAQRLIQNEATAEAHSHQDAITSVVIVGGSPMLISAHPVLQSDYSGPTAGTLILGRRLGAELTGQLNERLDAMVQFHPFVADADGRLDAVRAQLTGSDEALIVPDQVGWIRTYTLIRDLAGSPTLIGEIAQPRAIWQAGRQVILGALTIIVVAGIAFAGLLATMLDQVVLRRLGQLIVGVQQIGAQGFAARRVSISGHDELAELAATINSTLHALEIAEQERTRAHQAEIQLRDELFASQQRFLASVSHELRTPITPIAGYTEMLLDEAAGPITPDQRSFLSSISASAQRMRLLIDDLLDLGRLEANALRLDLRPVAVEHAVQEALAVLSPMLEQHRIPVEVAIPADLPPARADRQRLEQILINLISNAVKYNRPGGLVRVCAGLADEEMLAIAIEDTGIGLSEAQVAQLFTPFYRAEQEQATSVGGIGLGLYIVRSLTELHGGQIAVQSRVDQGSIFTVRIPIAASG
jgi:signal transduction histidine kinase